MVVAEITRVPGVRGRADHADEAPALGLGDRPGERDLDHVAVARRAVGVVRDVLGRALDVLAVQGVLNPALKQYRDALVHLIADYYTLLGPGVCCDLAHCPSPLRCFSWMTVRIRAMSRRTARNLCVCGN